jgi:hypothetical protein
MKTLEQKQPRSRTHRRRMHMRLQRDSPNWSADEPRNSHEGKLRARVLGFWRAIILGFWVSTGTNRWERAPQIEVFPCSAWRSHACEQSMMSHQVFPCWKRNDLGFRFRAYVPCTTVLQLKRSLPHWSTKDHVPLCERFLPFWGSLCIPARVHMLPTLGELVYMGRWECL